MIDFIKLIGSALIILLIIFLLLLGFGFIAIKFEQEHPCIKSHVETQTELPMYLQPGKDGGVAIPLGNIRQVQVTVCDVRK
jgi:hypothetical protein